MISTSSPLALMVRKLETHATLNADDRAALLALPYTLRTYEPSSYLVREGDAPEQCAVLLSGFAYRQKLTGSGMRQIVSLHIPGDALDLDLKTAPTGSEETQWGPLLPGAVFGRKNASGVYTTDTIRTFNASTFSRASACPAAATKMMKWPYANEFSSYVDGLVARGNTYHDIGLIWGARLMWPTGIFRAENEFTPQGGEIQRNLIFMTDGDACTDIDNYQA